MKYLFFIIFLTCWFGCANKSKVNPIYSWEQPYRIGDSILFASNNGLEESLTICDIRNSIVPDDPLSLFPKMMRQCSIIAQFSDGSKRKILNIRKTTDYEIIELRLWLGDNPNIYPNTVIDTNQDSSILKISENPNTFSIPAKEYWTGIKSENTTLENIIWSNKYGYINFSFKDGDFFKLKKLIRNNKIIYESTSKSPISHI